MPVKFTVLTVLAVVGTAGGFTYRELDEQGHEWLILPLIGVGVIGSFHDWPVLTEDFAGSVIRNWWASIVILTVSTGISTSQKR